MSLCTTPTLALKSATAVFELDWRRLSPTKAGMQEGTFWSTFLDFMGSNNHPVSVHTMEYHQDYLAVEFHCF